MAVVVLIKTIPVVAGAGSRSPASIAPQRRARPQLSACGAQVGTPPNSRTREVNKTGPVREMWTYLRPTGREYSYYASGQTYVFEGDRLVGVRWF